MTDLPSAARALVTGTLPADHDKLREAIDALSRAAHTPPSDFIGDGTCPECAHWDDGHCSECSYWDDAYRDALGVER